MSPGAELQRAPPGAKPAPSGCSHTPPGPSPVDRLGQRCTPLVEQSGGYHPCRFYSHSIHARLPCQPRIACNNGKLNCQSTIIGLSCQTYLFLSPAPGSVIPRRIPKGSRQEEKGERKKRASSLYLPFASNPFTSCLCTCAFLRGPGAAISLRGSSCIPRRDSTRTARCRGPVATGRPRPTGSGTCRGAVSFSPARRRSRRPAASGSSPAASC